MLEGHRGTFPGENRSHHIHGKSRDHGESDDARQTRRKSSAEPSENHVPNSPGPLL